MAGSKEGKNKGAQIANASGSNSAGKKDKQYSDALKTAAEPMKKSPSKSPRKPVALTDAQKNALDGFGLPPVEIFRADGWTRGEVGDAFKRGNKYLSTWRAKNKELERDEEERPLSGTLIWYAKKRGIPFNPMTTASEMYTKVPDYMQHGEECPRMWQVPINGSCC
jgi:hypothetical protein